MLGAAWLQGALQERLCRGSSTRVGPSDPGRSAQRGAVIYWNITGSEGENERTNIAFFNANSAESNPLAL